MSLKVFRINGIIFIIIAIIGWNAVFITMAFYTYGLFKFTKEGLWSFIILFSSLPLAVAIYDYFFFKMFIKIIRKNVGNFSRAQNYYYSCGIELSDNKALKRCPKCDANLEFLEILLKIS